MHGLKKTFVGEFSECLAPVVPDGCCVRAGIADQGREMRRQIVTPAALEFREQIGSPVGRVILEAVAENSVWWMIPKCRQQAITDGMKMVGDGLAVVVIEYESGSSGGRPLHHHSRAARNEEEDSLVGGGPGGKIQPWSRRNRQWARLLQIQISCGGRRDERGYQLFACFDCRHSYRCASGWNGNSFDA